MRKKLFFPLMLLAVAAVAVVSSPKPLNAEEELGEEHPCPCNGGCEGLKYYNTCTNGLCSWFCH